MLVLLTDDHLEEVQVRRREWGADRHDEVWNGIHHLPPVGRHSSLQQVLALLLGSGAGGHGLVPVLGAFELRELDDHRASDVAPPRVRGDQASTAALAVEIVTRGDDTQQRLRVFAADRVGELVIIDLGRRTVDWFALVGSEYERIEMSRLIDLGPARLAEMMAATSIRTIRSAT